VNFFDNLNSLAIWNKIPLNLTPKRKMKMKQAINKVEIEKNVLKDSSQVISNSATDNQSTKKANVVQLDRNVTLSRYLEACGDCV
jgi:hypothetical protein